MIRTYFSVASANVQDHRHGEAWVLYQKVETLARHFNGYDHIRVAAACFSSAVCQMVNKERVPDVQKVLADAKESYRICCQNDSDEKVAVLREKSYNMVQRLILFIDNVELDASAPVLKIQRSRPN